MIMKTFFPSQKQLPGETPAIKSHCNCLINGPKKGLSFFVFNRFATKRNNTNRFFCTTLILLLIHPFCPYLPDPFPTLKNVTPSGNEAVLALQPKPGHHNTRLGIRNLHVIVDEAMRPPGPSHWRVPKRNLCEGFGRWFAADISLVPSKWRYPHRNISCMDTAYVRENPSPKWPYKVQYLHFRYLKLLVMIGAESS